MFHTRKNLACLLIFASAAWAGCNKASDTAPAANSAPLTEKEQVAATELAKLPDGDRQAAIAQKICPVSDEPLGSMGAPLKVAVDGTDVWICCEGCTEILKKDPAQYLAKLKK